MEWKYWTLFTGTFVTVVYLYRAEIKKILNFIYRKIPENCPGPESEYAGKSESCKGCPNADKCLDGTAKVQLALDKELISNNLGKIKNIILVMSGKGGVGKSTVSAQLAFGLEQLGHTVGLLDIDITGPSIPGMTNTAGRDVHQSVHGWTPIYLSDKLAIMSIGYLMDKKDSAVIWRGAKKESLIKQFLLGVFWDELDYLVIDCPPGSSDEHIGIATYLTDLNTRSLIITTSQRRCVEDAVRSVDFCQKVNIPILGVVENMTNSFFDKLSSSTIVKVI